MIALCVKFKICHDGSVIMFQSYDLKHDDTVGWKRFWHTR